MSDMACEHVRQSEAPSPVKWRPRGSAGDGAVPCKRLLPAAAVQCQAKCMLGGQRDFPMGIKTPEPTENMHMKARLPLD